jgi:hypothetical protein
MRDAPLEHLILIDNPIGPAGEHPLSVALALACGCNAGSSAALASAWSMEMDAASDGNVLAADS